MDNLIDDVYVVSPNLPPRTVKLDEPEAALLLPRMTLNVVTSADQTCVKLPEIKPAVKDNLLLPTTTCMIWHRSEVSDPHVVRSHVELPTLITDVKLARPRLAPCTVTLVDPVEAPLGLRTTLSMLVSAECPEVTLPSRTPAVTFTRRLPVTP